MKVSNRIDEVAGRIRRNGKEEGIEKRQRERGRKGESK